MNQVMLFFEAWEFFETSVWSSILAGALLGLLGVYIVLRHMVFLSAALSQIASFGVALSYLFKSSGNFLFLSNPNLGALLGTASILWLSKRSRHSWMSQDMMLGIIYLFGLAGTLCLGTLIVQEIQDIHSVLFGSAVAVLPEDLSLLFWGTLLILGIHFWWSRGFIQVTTDPEGAKVRRIPVAFLNFILLSSIAIALSLSTRILGALPSFAFSVLPALVALRLAANIQQALWSACFLGGIYGFAGYMVAFLYDLPVGASQTLFALVSSFLILAVVQFAKRIMTLIEDKTLI